MEHESHALELTRYVHLNPVRARMVERPEEYGWSSYQDYLGVRRSPAWLDWETILGELAKDRRRARSAYRRFVEARLSEPPSSPLAAAVGGMFLGSGEWVERWRRRLAENPVREGVPAEKQLAWRPTLEDVVGAVSQTFGVEPAEVLLSRRHGNEARSAAIYLARLVTDEAVVVIGQYFGGVSRAAISKTVARLEHRRGEDRAWDRRLAKLSERLRTCERHGLPGLPGTRSRKASVDLCPWCIAPEADILGNRSSSLDNVTVRSIPARTRAASGPVACRSDRSHTSPEARNPLR